jgi:uncharacterized membrane protein
VATIAETEIDRQMSAGRAIDLAFATIRHNPGVTLGLALLIGAIPGLLLAYASSLIPAPAMNEVGTAFWSVMALSIIGGMVISALTQAFLTRATVAQAEGRKASFGECIKAGLAMFAPLVGLAILYSLAFGFGLLLLIVPGVIVMVAWSVAGPALIEEGGGIFESIRRSNDLTRGARWKIFSLMIAVGLIASLVSGAVEMTVGIDDSDPLATFSNPTYLLLSTLVGTIFSLISGTIQSAIYVELRDWKEGPATARLEEVFR